MCVRVFVEMRMANGKRGESHWQLTLHQGHWEVWRIAEFGRVSVLCSQAGATEEARSCQNSPPSRWLRDTGRPSLVSRGCPAVPAPPELLWSPPPASCSRPARLPLPRSPSPAHQLSLEKARRNQIPGAKEDRILPGWYPKLSPRRAQSRRVSPAGASRV